MKVEPKPKALEEQLQKFPRSAENMPIRDAIICAYYDGKRDGIVKSSEIFRDTYAVRGVTA